MHGLQILKFQDLQVPFDIYSDFIINVANIKCNIFMILGMLNYTLMCLNPLHVMYQHRQCDSFVPFFPNIMQYNKIWLQWFVSCRYSKAKLFPLKYCIYKKVHSMSERQTSIIPLSESHRLKLMRFIRLFIFRKT